jgi:hypothetical protein
LGSRRRADVRAYLASLAERRTEDVPLDRLALRLVELECTACHAYAAESGPDGFVRRYFVAQSGASIDGGPLPPDLTDVGAVLRMSWMREVLLAGAGARPDLATCMPQYGDAVVEDLPALLAGAAGYAADDGVAAPDDAHGGDER